MSVTRTSSLFASVRAQPSPAKPPPTITTCVFVVLVSTDPPASSPNRVSCTLLEQLGDQSRPSGLVRRSDSASRLAVDVLVEVDVVAELAVLLQLRIQRIDLSHARGVFHEDACEPVRQILGHLIDRDEAARARRTLDAKVVPVVVVELLKRLDDQEVDRKPDRTAPVRI